MLAPFFPSRKQTTTETTTPGILVMHDDLILLHTRRRFPAGWLATLSWLFAIFATLIYVSISNAHSNIGGAIRVVWYGARGSASQRGIFAHSRGIAM